MRKMLSNTDIELEVKNSFGPIRIYGDKGGTLINLICLFDIPLIDIESELEYSRYESMPDVKLNFTWVLNKFKINKVGA